MTLLSPQKAVLLALSIAVLAGVAVSQIPAYNCSTKVTMVSIGENYQLVLLSNGKILSWGDNDEGQLGIGEHRWNEGHVKTPQYVVSNEIFVSIAAGDRQSYAIRTDGTLWAFGEIAGDEEDDFLYYCRQDEPELFETPNNNWTSIVSEYHSAFGIKADNTLYVWGENLEGHLGIGPHKREDGEYVEVLKPLKHHGLWKAISAHGGQRFVISLEGGLYAWGSNTNGSLGLGYSSSLGFPLDDIFGILPVDTTRKWTAVSTSYGHTLALDNQGDLYAWGINTYYQLGDGTQQFKSLPTKIETGLKWVSVTAGHSCSFAITRDGDLYAWGKNDKGQLGDKTQVNRPKPIRIGSTLGRWKSVESKYITFGINENGVLFSWGNGVTEPTIVPLPCESSSPSSNGLRKLLVNPNKPQNNKPIKPVKEKKCRLRKKKQQQQQPTDKRQPPTKNKTPPPTNKLQSVTPARSNTKPALNTQNSRSSLVTNARKLHSTLRSLTKY